MRILSIDVGLRNLAWCLLSRSPSQSLKWQGAPWWGNEVQIINWKVVDIVEHSGIKEKINLNKTDIASIVPWFMKCLEDYKEIISENIDLVFIENQPSGHTLGAGVSISNVKTKVLSHVLQAFFVAKNIPVKFVSPANKLKDAGEFMTDYSQYSQHKKAAVALTEKCMGEMGEGFMAMWKGFKGKKDDLADAFLQGISSSLELATFKPKGVKRKRDAGKKPEKNLPVFEEEEERVEL
jgi:hypothetical protein